jgi:pimeloyl-ACP methyl ester carboxylesterase
MGEQNITEFTQARSGEPVLRPALEAEAVGLRSGGVAELIESLHTLLPDVDRAVLTDEHGEDTVAGFREALRTGVDGWVDDDLAFVKPWDFELDKISVPVFVWHGHQDLMAPIAHGQWLAQHVPGATAHLEPDEGHLSVIANRIGAMLDELVVTVDRRL